MKICTILVALCALFFHELLYAQAIAIHDCQGFLRSKVATEPGTTQTVTIGISEQATDTLSQVALRNIETGSEINAEIGAKSITFTAVPPGNYMIVTEDQGLYIGEISTTTSTGVASTAAGATSVVSSIGTTGIIVGGLVIATVTGVAIDSSTNGKGGSGGDDDSGSTPPPPSTDDDCNCDPNAEPDPLSPDDFFAKRGQRKMAALVNSNKDTSDTTTPFESGLHLNRITMNWWRDDELVAPENHSSPATDIPSQFVVTQDSKSTGSYHTTARLKLLSLSENSFIHAIGSLASGDTTQGGYANDNTRDREIYHTHGLAWSTYFEDFSFTAGRGINSRITTGEGGNDTLTQDLVALRTPLTSEIGLTGFYSALGVTSGTEQEERAGVMLDLFSHQTTQLQLLLSNRLGGNGDSVVEVQLSKPLQW